MKNRSARMREIALGGRRPHRDDGMLEQPAADEFDLHMGMADEFHRDARAVGHDDRLEILGKMARQLYVRSCRRRERRPVRAGSFGGGLFQAAPSPTSRLVRARQNRQPPTRPAGLRHARAAAAPRRQVRADRGGSYPRIRPSFWLKSLATRRPSCLNTCWIKALRSDVSMDSPFARNFLTLHDIARN